MKFKLPKLQVFLNGDKKIPDSDPTKNIHVIQGHAIVSNDIVAIVNIREYVKRQLKITEEDELDELTEIIDWFEGKSFSKDFWAELTSENIIQLIQDEDAIEITNPSFNSKLFYKHIETEIQRPFKLIIDNINRDEVEMSRFAFSGEHLSVLSKGFSSEMKGDNIIIKLTGTANAVIFSLQRRDYIFGILPEKFESSMDISAFLSCDDLYEKMKIQEIKEK